MDIAASRVSAEVWCARCKMLSASMSKVKATAHRAPFGHGTGLAIMGCPPLRASWIRVTIGAYACMPQDTTRAPHAQRRVPRAEALSRATDGSGAGAATVRNAGDTEIVAPGGKIQGGAHT